MKTTFMLVRKGKVQRMSTDWGICWPIAETYDDAKRLCGWIGDSKIRVAEIGAVEGETLAEHLSLAIDDGCKYVICVNDWSGDGSPAWKYLKMDIDQAEA